MVKINITQNITYNMFVTRKHDEEAEYKDVQGEVYNGFVNALDSTHGNWGVSSFQFTRNQYKSIELVAVENPVYKGYYVWMLIDAKYGNGITINNLSLNEYKHMTFDSGLLTDYNV
jgi:hypothetical protein